MNNSNFNKLLEDTRNIRKDIEKKVLQIAGTSYDLSEWVTIKEYVKRHSLSSTNVVSNWIERGIISNEDIIEISELNGLKLIRDKIYR